MKSLSGRGALCGKSQSWALAHTCGYHHLPVSVAGLDYAMTWEGTEILESYLSNTLRLQFWMENTKLYLFWFELERLILPLQENTAYAEIVARIGSRARRRLR